MEPGLFLHLTGTCQEMQQMHPPSIAKHIQSIQPKQQEVSTTKTKMQSQTKGNKPVGSVNTLGPWDVLSSLQISSSSATRALSSAHCHALPTYDCCHCIEVKVENMNSIEVASLKWQTVLHSAPIIVHAEVGLDGCSKAIESSYSSWSWWSLPATLS